MTAMKSSLRRRLAAIVSLALALTLAAGVASARPAQAYAWSFYDVSPEHWVVTEGWLDYVTSNGIMMGYEGERAGQFGPDNAITRAEFATMLWRIAGSGGAADPGFPDVSPGDWFYDAVAWCKQQGIITGYPETGTFEPNRTINRAELATMSYRFASYMGADMSADELAYDSTADHAFLDTGDSAYSYARPYLIWTCDKGVLTGVIDQGADWLDVSWGATRAQAAKVVTVLKRCAIDRSGVFTVSFEPNGGSAVPAQTVAAGSKATRVYPTLDGRRFVGWYTDAALTHEYTFASDVTGDVTLYAKWA